MSKVMLDRRETVRRIEELGIVAVIRLRDPGKLRAVVDAIMAGGVRALEVTMTVPGAVELIRGLAPTLPEGFLLGAGTVIDPETARAVVDAGAQFVISPVFRRSVIEACHACGVPAAPGLLHPDRDPRGARRRRRHRESIPGDDAGTAVHQGCPRAAAASEADADRRGDAG